MEYQEQSVKGNIDFHLHSNMSDGTYSMKEIINLALSEKKLRVIAITDHNYFAITHKYFADANGHVLQVLPGCEFSTTFTFPSGKKEEIHVIGIFPNNVKPEAFDDLFALIAEGKTRYVEAILENLRKLGIDLDLETVMKEKRPTGYIGRFHIAELMVRLGYGSTVDEIMDRYIGNYSPYYLPSTNYIAYAEFQTVIERIHAQSGFPILAHPYSYHKLSEEDVITLIGSFKEAAGTVAGMEVYYNEYTKEKQASLCELAKKYDLVPSAASDRHREDQSFADFGGYSFYEEMLERLRKNEG